MQKIIFIDRDGVINKDPGGRTRHNYVTKWEEFAFIDGSIEALKKLKEADYKIFLISNQGGISKGYFTKEDLDRLNRRVLAEIEKRGGGIDELYYCHHHDEDNCECRKPKTGLIEQAIRNRDVDLANTFIIGDSLRDVAAGKRMGMKAILVLSGKTELSKTKEWEIKPDCVKKDLLDAVKWVLERENKSHGGK